MYIYTIKYNDEPATGNVLAFFGSQRNKAIVTYDGGDVNRIHHTGGTVYRHRRGPQWDAG